VGRRILLLLLVLSGCAAPRQAVRDETVRWHGATLAVPVGWWVARAGERLTLRDPDGKLSLTLVESAGEARAAVAGAWRKVDPGFSLSPDDVDTPPPSGGWDAVTDIRYATPAAGARQARALWRSLNGRGWVALIDGDRDALDRRDAQLGTILGSLHPPGWQDERLGRLRPLDAATVDAFAERALRTLAVPGAAIAVLAGGRVVYERALGVRVLGQAAPVTPDTLFLLGSITKPMTTLMQGALVDAGLLRWDTPVSELMPEFALGDAALTRQLRLWHMSCACTGMPTQDMEYLFEWEGVTPEMRLASMRTMKPTTSLGETFQYSNLMVAAGGYVAAHAFAPERPLAEAYAAVMQAKLFGPIGMSATTLDFAAVERGEHALPHALALDGTTHAMPLAIERAVEPIAPAGGVWTTLRDMERYAATELAEGVAPGGRRIASAAATRCGPGCAYARATPAAMASGSAWGATPACAPSRTTAARSASAPRCSCCRTRGWAS
jgi:CubicO group peptidase (beta-lactamase class C family)